MDILSLIYIGGAALSASGATFFLTRKKKEDTGFTVKSDGHVKVDLDGRNGNGYQPFPTNEEMPDYRPPETIIDMKDIDGIRVEGSPTIKINNGVIHVSESAIVSTSKRTLFVKNIESISNSAVYNVSSSKSENMKQINTINFSHGLLSRLSIEGSGDIDVRNMKLSNELSLIVKGSGDIVIENISTGSLSLMLKGSGDIIVGSYCQATSTIADVQGSGDIKIKSKSIGVVAGNVQGSGDISIPDVKKPKKSSKMSYPKTGGGFFHKKQVRGVTSTYTGKYGSYGRDLGFGN